MNWMMTKRKFFVKCRRIVNRIKRRLRRDPSNTTSITEKRKAINLNTKDFWDFFNPRICHILTIWSRKKHAHMAPIKWVTEIRVNPHKIAMALFEGGEAEKLIRKSKAFTISQISNKYAKDYYRLIKLLPNKGVVTAISRFRAEPAFFIKGFKVHHMPWIECSLEKIIKIDSETVIVVGKIEHISKMKNANKEKLMHLYDNLFINTKTMVSKPWDKI